MVKKDKKARRNKKNLSDKMLTNLAVSVNQIRASFWPWQSGTTIVVDFTCETKLMRK